MCLVYIRCAQNQGMYVCLHIPIHICIYIYYICMYACKDVCNVCMHVCMYVPIERKKRERERERERERDTQLYRRRPQTVPVPSHEWSHRGGQTSGPAAHSSEQPRPMFVVMRGPQTFLIGDMHTCSHTYVQTCIHACIQIHMHAGVRTYVRTYIHTYIHTSLSLSTTAQMSLKAKQFVCIVLWMVPWLLLFTAQCAASTKTSCRRCTTSRRLVMLVNLTLHCLLFEL